MSIEVSEQKLEKELDLLRRLMRSIDQGLDGMDYVMGGCSHMVLSLCRLGLITGEEKLALLDEVQQLYRKGLDARAAKVAGGYA
ncbi:hypothetical protein L4V65_006852 [Pseudomonas aeruginosa]|uniref:hypothetical protein n=1 Tax=Pseudomonas aeruginosa TaxID=287 RepID=UPI00155F3122|nr:hypothetical protein [Pseudomonas aeruginosa]EKU7350776.1 hypothetical protein [Pseudomonas aeruginosa]EKU9479097.1 hypothetical protein [Pseudomonas aeruginosa]EKY0302441.1 hypothetical protein [Pseudomonas aeruginosa]EKY0506306.1 hypothetical protein [Pseudomonas aeruginosa]ELD6211945.1 hypothetical protein [Pseudomonas aeruginosa]